MAAQLCCNLTLRAGMPGLRRAYISVGLGFLPTAPELQAIEEAQVPIVMYVLWLFS
jgi:hypothetical protein